MRNKPIKHATILALAGLCGVIFLQTLARADLVLPGYDLFTTAPSGSYVTVPPVGTIPLTGVPLVNYNFGGSIGWQYVGNTDTIMQRLGSSGNGQTVGLQMDALQLVTTTPYAFLGGNYGYITLDPSQVSGGTVTINADGTYSTDFDVYYDMHVGSLNGPIAASGEAVDMQGSGNWQHPPTPGALLITGVNYLLDGTDTANDFWIVIPLSGVLEESDSALDESHVFVTTIPEPSGLVLFGLGALAVVAKVRRGRK